jgi:predicted nucleic acid-binding protein
VILLDTNYLIRCLLADSEEARHVDTWMEHEQPLCTSSICWYEFVSGPVDAEGIEIIRSALSDRILAFDTAAAREAANLFNRAGRPRRLRVDAMIAATAMAAGARLAPANRSDFRAFTLMGLELA